MDNLSTDEWKSAAIYHLCVDYSLNKRICVYFGVQATRFQSEKTTSESMEAGRWNSTNQQIIGSKLHNDATRRLSKLMSNFLIPAV